MRKFLVLPFSVIILSFLGVIHPVLGAEGINVPVAGLPLQYERVYNYGNPYPDVSGFYVEIINGEGPAVRAGLREGNIITRVDGQPVQTLNEIRAIIQENFGKELEFTVYQIAPRYKKRMQDDPFYKPTGSKIYQKSSFVVTYQKPGEEKQPVVAGPTNKLYHKLALNHSPDTKTNTVYKNPDYAKRGGLEPCPVCFPGGTDSLQAMIRQRILGAEKFVKTLTQDDRKIEPTPSSVREILRQLSQYRLRDSLDADPAVYEAPKMYGFGLASGDIVFTRDLYAFAETEAKRALFLGHLLAHADREHEHSPVEEQQIRSLIEQAIQRTTGVGFEFSQIKEWSPAIPGFGYYSEIIEQGYGDKNEREAIFLGMVYAYRAGYDIKLMDEWLNARRDMINDVREDWIDYLLVHPLPPDIDQDVKHWQKLIPKHFDRSE